MRALLTGASGFVGRGVLTELSRHLAGDLAIAGRTKAWRKPGLTCHALGDFDEGTDWRRAVAGRESVIHLAGLAHRVGSLADIVSDFDRANHLATANLAEQAARAGVQRFIYMSSVAVFGRDSTDGEPISSISPIRPRTPYAESKARAEEALWRISARTGMEAVVIRPPLVSGPNAPGNYGRLVRLVRRRIPLPFASIDNRRSIIGRANLADLVVRCVMHSGAAGQAFLASDDDDVSTPRLIRSLAHGMGLRPMIFEAAPALVRPAIRIVAGRRASEQLTQSFVLDISATKRCLDWRPPLSANQCIEDSVHADPLGLSETASSLPRTDRPSSPSPASAPTHRW